MAIAKWEVRHYGPAPLGGTQFVLAPEALPPGVPPRQFPRLQQLIAQAQAEVRGLLETDPAVRRWRQLEQQRAELGRQVEDLGRLHQSLSKRVEAVKRSEASTLAAQLFAAERDRGQAEAELSEARQRLELLGGVVQEAERKAGAALAHHSSRVADRLSVAHLGAVREALARAAAAAAEHLEEAMALILGGQAIYGSRSALVPLEDLLEPERPSLPASPRVAKLVEAPHFGRIEGPRPPTTPEGKQWVRPGEAPASVIEE